MGRLSRGKSVIAALGCLLLSGCVGFWRDRRNDLADVFTLSVEPGVGAKVRVSSLGVGAYVGGPGYGLRGGVFGEQSTPSNSGQPCTESAVFLVFGSEKFWPNSGWAALRCKAFSADGVPLIDKASEREGSNSGRGEHTVDTSIDALVTDEFELEGGPRRSASFYTDVELNLGLFYGPRIGVNPGEFLDLVVGFFGLDLYGDDYYARIEEQLVIEFFDVDGTLLIPERVKSGQWDLFVVPEGFATTDRGRPSREPITVVFGATDSAPRGVLEVGRPRGDGVFQVILDRDEMQVVDLRFCPWEQWRR